MISWWLALIAGVLGAILGGGAGVLLMAMLVDWAGGAVTQAIVRAVLDALAVDPAIASRLAELTDEERAGVEQRCVAAAEETAA